jgi:LPXTG-motif cell wall-anchored protein
LLALLVFASAVSAQDTTGASQQEPALDGETTAQTSSASASASPAETTSSADAQTADVNRDADEFRCEFFLHVVGDDRGNVRRQYQDEDQITRRFERCLSKDVIPGTIVKRRLPNTGGVPLLVLGFPAIALVGAGILLARRR